MKFLAFIFLFALSAFFSANESDQKFTVNVGIELDCPTSPELLNFIDTIPNESDEDPNDWNSWSNDFCSSMRRLIELVESGEVGNATFSISVTEHEQENQ